MSVSSVSPIVASSERTPSSGASPSAESDSHLRTQFLRRVAHDIASPTGVTMTVLDELASSDKPRPELIAMARRSLRRLMRLSEGLALVAELEAGLLEPELSGVDVRDLTKRALDDAVRIDGRKDVLAASSLPSEALLIAGDQRLLQTVVREVIGNALRIAASRVEVSVELDGAGHVVIRVEDDGPGFSEEARNMLGKRFMRREAARGLGLSLSMAIDILSAHRGTLTLDTSRLPPGRRGVAGAAVIVTLPASTDDVASVL